MVSASPLKIVELDVPLELFEDEEDVHSCKELTAAAEKDTQQLEERESDTDSSIIQPINKSRLLRKQKRRVQCGACPGCRREDCGVCSYCKGMIKFGGNGKLKKRCKQRECQYMFKAINESIIGKYFKDSTSPESATPSPSKDTPPSTNGHVAAVPVAKRRKLSALNESPLPPSKPVRTSATPTPIVATTTEKMGLMKRPSSPRRFSSPRKGSLLRQPSRGSPRKSSSALQFGIVKREDLTPPTDHAPYQGLIHVCRGQLPNNNNTMISCPRVKPTAIHNPIPATSIGMDLSLGSNAGVLYDIGGCCHGDLPPTRGDVLMRVKGMYPSDDVEGILERYVSVRKQLDHVVMTTCPTHSVPGNIPGTPVSAHHVKEKRKRGRPRGSGRGLSPRGRGLPCSIAVTRDPKGLIIVNADSYTTRSVATPINGRGQQPSSPRKRRTSFRLAQERLTKEAESVAELKVESIINKENKKPLICSMATPTESRPHPQEEPPSCAFGVHQWNHLYRPIRSHDIIGNKVGVAKIHDWLSKWKSSSNNSNNGRGLVMNTQGCHDNTDPQPTRRRRQRLIDLNESLNSSFCSNEVEESEEVGVALLVCGPVGCGKTATVYACAEELGYKVLEVNSAHCRSRQSLLSILREATQSHHVGVQAPPPVATVTMSTKTPSAPPKGLMAFFKPKQPTNQKQPPKQQDGVAGKHVAMETNTLMLLEEVDLLYEDERRGFWSAITEIVQDAKRPLIFTVNDSEMELPFKHSKIILNTPSVDDIALHCQLLSLSHDSHMTHSTAVQLVSHTGSDIRRVFNLLHFYLNTMTEGVWQGAGQRVESQKGTGMPFKGLEHTLLHQLTASHTLSSIKDLPQLINCLKLLHHVDPYLTDRLLPFLIGTVEPVQTTPLQTTPTTHSYEHLDRCVRICDGLAHGDIITRSCDRYSMSHDLHAPWWQSHVTTSLMDDLPLRTPLDLTGQYGTALEACLVLGEGTGTWEPDCGRVGDKQYIREAHDCHMTSCEVFSVRSELARRPLMTECLPYLHLICRKESERERGHCTSATSRRRFTHYLTHSGVDLPSFTELVNKCSYNCKN